MMKTAIELVPGDRIVNSGDFPRSLFMGVVDTAVVVDGGVQIGLVGGGSYVRAEDHQFVVEKKSADEMSREELVAVLLRFNPWGGYCVEPCSHKGHTDDAYRQTVKRIRGEAVA